MNKKLVITNCRMCPSFDHKGGFSRTAYAPVCRALKRDLPYTPSHINGGYCTAIPTEVIPSWCPLEDNEGGIPSPSPSPVRPPKDSKIIPLRCITKLDLPVDSILEASKETLKGVVILGYDLDGEEYFSSSYADGGEVLWLLKRCERNLLNI